MVDGRGGCCIARYAAGGGHDMAKVDRIMLRFRPIAPKPAAGGSVSGGSSAENHEVYVRSGRGKRRYVRDGKSSSKRKRKVSSEETDPVHKTSSGGSVSSGETVVTLPLLPETPDRKDSPARGSPSDQSDHTTTERQAHNQPIWLNFSNNNNSSKVDDNHSSSGVGHASVGLDRTVVMMPQPVRAVGSVVTVECVTDTWVDGSGLGCRDEERMRTLEWDTCPGFISDGLNRVRWTNGAYREMVGHVGGGEVVVWLVMKERVPIIYPAFTCRVRLQYTCGKGRSSSLTMPCDVWKMDGGGFAWRLDIKAALSLGR